MVDDFCVADSELWETVGSALLTELKQVAKQGGAVQVVVVSGFHDNAKCTFLNQQNLEMTSVWYTGQL